MADAIRVWHCTCEGDHVTKVVRDRAPAVTDRAANRRAGRTDEIIGGRLRTARNAAAMSLEELAARVNISPQQLYKYESGANRITVSRLIEICDAMAIELDAVLQLGNQSQPDGLDPKEIAQLVSCFCAIRNPASRKQITDLAKFLASFETTTG
jgi:transcriptional regulator with XRE-family HTH domain